MWLLEHHPATRERWGTRAEPDAGAAAAQTFAAMATVFREARDARTLASEGTRALAPAEPARPALRESSSASEQDGGAGQG